MNLRNIIKLFIPKIILILYNYFFASIRYTKEYSNWKSAEENSLTYNNSIFFEKLESNYDNLIKKNDYKYERDTVLFKEIQYSIPLLVFFFQIQKKIEDFDILDFGGSLGSTYYQNKELFKNTKLKWGIVEQSKIVDLGKKKFEINPIKFFYSIQECIANNNPNVAIFSSVVQYLDNFENYIKDLEQSNIKYLILDRIPLTNLSKNIITVQITSKRIYKSSYPITFFSRKILMNFLEKNWDLVSELDSEIDGKNFKYRGINIIYKAMLLKKRNV